MPNTRRIYGLVVASLLAAAAAWSAHAEDAREAPAKDVVRLTIVHTNDLHAHLENFAAVAQVAKDQRARNPNTLFLDAGDCITGTPVSTFFQGTPIFEVMNAMGYDAGAIGNHEFDHGWRKIHDFVDLAKRPMLCANANDPSGKPFGDAPYKVFDVGGVKVGVIGLITDDVPTITTAKASEGCTFEAPVEAARRLVPEVRKKADMVVLLTHCGVEADAAVAGAVPGIDLIVGGHSHTRLAKAIEVKVPAAAGTATAPATPTRIVQAFRWGACVGVVDLDWDRARNAVASFEYRLVPVADRDLPKDPAVQKIVDAWQAKIDPQMAVVIGKTKTALTPQQLRPLIERIYKDALGADFGYQNVAGIRSGIAAGDIKVGDVVTVLPFPNTMVKITLRGEQVPAYYRDRMGRAFDPAKDYVCATNSFVGDQCQKYLRVKDAPIEDTGLLMYDVAIEWVRAHGGFLPAGEPLPTPDERPDPR